MTLITLKSGYSTDLEKLTLSRCFNTEYNIGIPSVYHSYDNSMNFKQLQKTIETQIDKSFVVHAKKSFGSNIYGDLKYSSSFNYYTHVSVSVEEKADASCKTDFLTDLGKRVYENNYKNFNIICGDKYAENYEVGSYLLISIDVRFSEYKHKSIFEKKSGWNLGFIKSTKKIKEVLEQHELQGSIIVKAFQKGGNPMELSSIFHTTDKSGGYIYNCNLDNLKACEEIQNRALEYSHNSYPKQFSSYTVEGLDYLGGSIKLTPIEQYGIVIPPLMVTQDIFACRKRLGEGIESIEKNFNSFEELVVEFANSFPKTYKQEFHSYGDKVLLYEEILQNYKMKLEKCFTYGEFLNCQSQCDEDIQKEIDLMQSYKNDAETFLAKTLDKNNFNLENSALVIQQLKDTPEEKREKVLKSHIILNDDKTPNTNSELNDAVHCILGILDEC